MNIDEEVEKTLRALDDVERVETNPYFYTRLQQRIENEEAGEARPPLIFSKLWQPALLGLLVIFNVFTLFQMNDGNMNASQDGVSVLVQEYQYNSSNALNDYAAPDDF